MENKKSAYGKKQIEKMLQKGILKISENSGTELNSDNFEMISKNQTQYTSPIFTMNEDELLAFVEEFNVEELATLSNAELRHLEQILHNNS